MMHDDVRELLEQYELNTTHLVVKRGAIEDGKIFCDTNGVHVGDNTNYIANYYVVKCDEVPNLDNVELTEGFDNAEQKSADHGAGD